MELFSDGETGKIVSTTVSISDNDSDLSSLSGNVKAESSNDKIVAVVAVTGKGSAYDIVMKNTAVEGEATVSVSVSR